MYENGPKTTEGFFMRGGEGRDGMGPSPPPKIRGTPGLACGGGGEGGGDPEFGGGNVPFWGCGPFKRGAHPGLQLTAFWGKKVRFWGWGVPFWGTPLLGGVS